MATTSQQYLGQSGFPGDPLSAQALLVRIRALEDAFNRLPPLTGNAGSVVTVNAEENGLDTTGAVSVAADALTGDTLADNVLNAALNLITPDGGMLNIAGALTVGGVVVPTRTTGIWTPVGNGITLSTATGAYTKIDDIAIVTFEIVFPVTANASGANITGLPFSAGTNLRNGAAIGFTTDTAGNTLVAFGSTLQIYNTSGSLTTNASNSTKQYYGTIVYKT